MFVKRAMGSTLQAVATEYDVTREWVRQICSKNERKIMPLLSPLISELTDTNGARFLREEQIREYIDNEMYASAVIYTLREGEQFESFGSPLIFFEAVSFPDVKNRLAELACDIVGDGINIFESAESIESALDAAGYGFLSADDFLGLLIVLEYKFYGDYVLKDRKSYGRLCIRIIEEHFPDGVSNSKEDMDRLRALVKQEYGDLDLPDSDRAMYARICDYLILRGRSNCAPSLRRDSGSSGSSSCLRISANRFPPIPGHKQIIPTCLDICSNVRVLLQDSKKKGYVKMKTFKTEKSPNYDYIPDISPIMGQIGAKMTLIDILDDISYAQPQEFPLKPFFYRPNDINGKITKFFHFSHSFIH